MNLNHISLLRPLDSVIRTLPALFVLQALLPAQTPQNFGLFPDALYAVQPELDRALHLSDEQTKKITTRCEPLREELRGLEEEAAAAEPAKRGEILSKLETTRAELGAAMISLVMPVLSAEQKALLAQTGQLHAVAVRGAAEELAKTVAKGETPRIDPLIREQILKLCPGLDSNDAEKSELALRTGLTKLGATSADAKTTSGKPEPESKPQDQLRELGEAAAKAALQSVLDEMLKKHESRKQ